jgi:ArsR family transcriptional regulator
MRIRSDKEINISEESKLIASASDAFAHPLRVELFRYVYKENMQRKGVCTKELVAHFGYSQSTISQHMKKLLISGLLEGKRENSFLYYYVNLGTLSKFLNAVKKLNS